MTGFLDHLILRSTSSPVGLQPGEILRPRLPSLFETPAGTNALPPDFSGTDRPVESQPVDRLSERPLDEAHAPAPAFTSAEAGERQPAFKERVAPEPGMFARSNGSFDLENESGHPDRLAGGARFDRRIGDAGLLRAREPGIAADRTPHLSPSPALEAGDGGADPERGRIAASTAPAAGPDEARVQSTRIDPLRPASFAVPGDVPSLVDHRSAAFLPAASEGIESAFQAPTVHIRIGRIEVRAGTQPPQPPARTPAAPRPKLTLDEYLRQRNEGKR
jgi:hypothetical protein